MRRQPVYSKLLNRTIHTNATIINCQLCCSSPRITRKTCTENDTILAARFLLKTRDTCPNFHRDAVISPECIDALKELRFTIKTTWGDVDSKDWMRIEKAARLDDVVDEHSCRDRAFGTQNTKLAQLHRRIRFERTEMFESSNCGKNRKEFWRDFQHAKKEFV